MKVGDNIVLRGIEDCPEFNGRGGVITDIIEELSGETTIYGTWGWLPVFPEVDWIEVVENGGNLLTEIQSILTPEPQTIKEIWEQTDGCLGDVAALLRRLVESESEQVYSTELVDAFNDSIEKAYGLI